MALPAPGPASGTVRAAVRPDAGERIARFGGRGLLYGFGELDAPAPAHAATVHERNIRRW